MLYREKITIKTPTSARGDYGAVTETYTDKLTTGANIRQLGGSESVINDAETTLVTSSFEVHRTPATVAINTLDRLFTSDGNEWDITNVDSLSFRRLKLVKITAISRR